MEMMGEKVKVLRILIEKAPALLVSTIKASQYSPRLETIAEEDEAQEITQNDASSIPTSIILALSSSSSSVQVF